MKTKNRPKRDKRKPKKPTRQKRFNPWIYKYFDMTNKNTNEKEEDKNER